MGRHFRILLGSAMLLSLGGSFARSEGRNGEASIEDEV
jgi:hypothetical protein